MLSARLDQMIDLGHEARGVHFALTCFGTPKHSDSLNSKLDAARKLP